jgi:uncharacterized protein YndB with AHSA1/START domain
MADNSTHHGTVVFERTYDAPISCVYAALADPVARANWSAPSDTSIFVYDETDFRVGGRDIFRCGSSSDPRYRGETHYHDIVPERRIVSTEVVDELDKRLSADVITVELERAGERTKLKLTVQIVSLDGPEMIEGTKSGYTDALDNLGRYLPQRQRAVQLAQAASRGVGWRRRFGLCLCSWLNFSIVRHLSSLRFCRHFLLRLYSDRSVG